MNRTRVREFPGLGFGISTDWSYKHTVNSSILENYPLGTESQVTPSSAQGLEVTRDENHGFRDYKGSIQNDYVLGIAYQDGDTLPEVLANNRRLQSGDIGGEFDSSKHWGWVQYPTNNVIEASYVDFGLHRIKYTGPIVALPKGAATYPVLDDENLDPRGATAISRCKPTNNVANLAVDIAETFQQGAPKMIGHALWKERSNALKGLGNEYLNAEFGWKPLASDIRSACYATQNAHRLMEGYERNSGKNVRRRYEFPIEETHTSSIIEANNSGWLLGGPSPGSSDYNRMMVPGLPLGSIRKTDYVYKRTWFSGSFTYHLPTDYRSRGWLRDKVREARHLYGLEITPEVVWNATPWTWAADWVSNIGDIVSNVSAWSTDGLVLRYGYVMQHELRSTTYTLEGFPSWNSKWPVFVSPVTLFYERKRRRRATPFGFGVDFNSFTPRQLAIAAALGISRLL